MNKSTTPPIPGTPGERLTEARKKAGYRSARAAAEALGVPESTYRSHEKAGDPRAAETDSARKFDEKHARAYARLFRTDAAWLLRGERRRSTITSLPIIGTVGAGSEVYGIDGSEGDTIYGEIESVLPLPDGTVTVIVEGNSMYPRYDDGDVIGFIRDGRTPEDLINTECIIKVEDGPYLVKKLRRGPEPGLYSLESVNAPLIEGVRVAWAAEVNCVIRAAQHRRMLKHRP